MPIPNTKYPKRTVVSPYGIADRRATKEPSLKLVKPEKRAQLR
jgi:hypothetical protein